MPDAVYVDIGDLETDTYFAAEATVRVQASAMIVVKIEWEGKQDHELTEEVEVEVDEIEDVIVIEDNTRCTNATAQVHRKGTRRRLPRYSNWQAYR